MTKKNLAPYKLLVREEHLDTFGHVNNAVYLELFEAARWEYITTHGYGMKEVKLFEKGPVILELNLKFKKELNLREEIMIETDYPVAVNSLLMKMNQRIIKCSTQEIASELNMTFGLFDLRLRKLIAPTPEWLKVMGGQDS